MSTQAATFARDLVADARRADAQRGTEALAGALQAGCWVYGAGGYGRLVARLLAARGFAVAGFVDRRAGAALCAELGARVVTPDAIGDEAGGVLVVGVHNFTADQAPIVAWGRQAGFAEVVLPADLPDLVGPAAGSYWLTGRAHVVDHAEAVQRVAGLLADQRSVDVLGAIARFRATGAIAAYPPSDLPSQYFPADVPLPRGPLKLVDGGAYTGDVIAAAAASGRSLAEWYAFEPDPANFRLLAETARTARVPHTALFPCGLGDAVQQIGFASGGDAGSHASAEGGDMAVQVVAFDEVLPTAAPDFVKLDIEGFEREALVGMRRMIAAHRPALAMSVYHKPEDLWELPLLVHDMLPDSRLYLRQHGFGGFDTVLYAVS